MTGEKFCLKWRNFQSNVSKSFSFLRNEKEFSDVTLNSDDCNLVTAHKVVLSTCSEYFRDILTQNKHHNPLICLEGISDVDLNKVLDYIYHGEIQVYQDYLERFLHLARRFKLDGLTVGNNDSEETIPKFDPPPQSMKNEHLEESVPTEVDGQIVDKICPNESTSTEEFCNLGEVAQDSADVSWYFLKTRKTSHGPGALITHSDKYKFSVCNSARHEIYDGKKSFWWYCSERKRTGCKATAVLKKKTIPGKNGEEDKIEHKLVRVATEGAHAMYHGPIHHKIQAEKIMIKLKRMATDNMFDKLVALEKSVLEEDLWSKYSEEEAKLIRANMPERIFHALTIVRQRFRKKHLKSLEEDEDW